MGGWNRIAVTTAHRRTGSVRQDSFFWLERKFVYICAAESFLSAALRWRN